MTFTFDSSSFCTMVPVSDLSSGDVLVPRQYQQEIFLKAQQRNVIAVLDTGSGKTLISVLLIKWVFRQESSKNKVIVFLVPKVPLVEQQGKFIAQHTALRVAQVHSDVSAGVMDRARWSNLFSQSDVLVMTGKPTCLLSVSSFSSFSGQIFLNVLTHSHWGMNRVCMRMSYVFIQRFYPKWYQVSLLIFDECHHAHKNHPYTTVMTIYRACPESDRPKVFGMTACPTRSSNAQQTSLASLEKNLNSKIVTVQEHLDEFARYSSKPTEVDQCTGVLACKLPSQRPIVDHPEIPPASVGLS
jgi:endoribonuclease Dicer